MDSQITSTGP